MGRVSRYKKVRSCDPFSKQNACRSLDTVGIWGLGETGRRAKKRSRTAERLREQKWNRRNKKRKGRDNVDCHQDRDAFFDLPPDKDDFDLADPEGSLKRQRLPPTTQEKFTGEKEPAARSPVAADDDKEERRIAKLLKLDSQVDKPKPIVAAADRLEGESKRAYRKRVMAETRQIIKRQTQEEYNPAKRQRRKDFLKNKKSKKEKKNGRRCLYPEEEMGDGFAGRPNAGRDSSAGEVFLTGEQAVAARAAATAVRFGEQAERPPVFRQLPRGAGPSNNGSKNVATKNGRRDMSMTAEEIRAEQNAMEQMRRKVQAQYAVIKTKRKRAGDFHL